MGGLVLPGSGGGYVNPIATPVVDYDFKQNLLYGPQLSVSRASSAYIDDLAGNWTLIPANTLRRSDKGALIEGQQTNSIRNNSMQGAVVGTPGTLPTNWAVSLVAGLSSQVVGTSVRQGVDIVSVRIFGTTTASGIGTIGTESGTFANAASAQLWTYSKFLALSAGTANNVTFAMELRENSSSGAFLVNSTAAITIDSTLRRQGISRTLNNASTAFAQGRLDYSVASGVAVDFTVDIGWPQIEQWNPAASTVGGASSPIRTTGAAATRAADVVTAVLPQGLSALTAVVVVRNPPFRVVNAGEFQINDGTQANLVGIKRMGDAANTQAYIRGGNATSAGMPQVAFGSDGQRSAKAIAYAPGGPAAVSVDGVLVESTPNLAPTNLNTLNIGFGAVTTFCFGYIERLAILPTRMVNAELQRLSTLSTWGG